MPLWLKSAPAFEIIEVTLPFENQMSTFRHGSRN